MFFQNINKLKILVFGILSLLIFTALFSGQKTIPPIDRDEARFAQASRQKIGRAHGTPVTDVSRMPSSA